MLQFVLSRLISNPDETVAVIFPVRLVPDTLILVDDDGVPVVVLKAEKLPVFEMVGVNVVKLAGLPVAVLVL